MTKHKNVKIYKTATQRSIMDVTSALEYHKEKSNGEFEYKGNVVFAITEMGNQKKYEKAFVSKKSAKVLFYSIINHTFHNLYKNGFVEYGGSKTNGQVRARVFSVKLDQKNRFIFQIDEGSGKLGPNGSIQMANKEKTVQTYVAYEEAQKMAHEVYDYIKESELVAMIDGKPYFTLTPTYENGNQKQNEKENTQQSYSSSYPYSNEYSEPSQQSQTQQQNEGEGYIIKIGNLKGTSIKTLETTVLEMIISKVDPDDDDKRELIEEARKELATRY